MTIQVYANTYKWSDNMPRNTKNEKFLCINCPNRQQVLGRVVIDCEPTSGNGNGLIVSAVDDDGCRSALGVVDDLFDPMGNFPSITTMTKTASDTKDVVARRVNQCTGPDPHDHCPAFGSQALRTIVPPIHRLNQ